MTELMDSEVVTERDVMVTMRDGVQLRTDIYRPAASGRYPVLLMRTPYPLESPSVGEPLGAQLARCGFAHVAQHCRGCFGSEGTYIPHSSDIADGYDAVEWAAARPWSNGRVGMIGASHPGLTQWSAAIAHPPHLVAIAPESSPWRFFGTSVWYTSPGVMSVELALDWTLMMVGWEAERRGIPPPFPEIEANQRDLPDFHDAEAVALYLERLAAAQGSLLKHRPLRDLPGLAGLAPWWQEWCDHPEPDNYWRSVQAADYRDQIAIPVLHHTGWYDFHPNAATEAFAVLEREGMSEATRRGQRLVIGPWPHGGASPREDIPPPPSRGPWLDISEDSTLMQFLEEHVKELDRGLSAHAPVRLYVMGENVWRDEWEWPLARTQWTPYYIHSTGHANSSPDDGTLLPTPPTEEPSDAYLFDPTDPVLTPKIHGIFAGDPTQFDQRPIEARPDVLVYTTPALESPIEVTGPVTAELWASSSAPDTDFTAKLVDVLPDGRAWPLCQGITRARYRQPNADPLQPDEAYQFKITLWPTSILFGKGHRIRLEVSSSEWPTWEINPNTGSRITNDAAMEIAAQRVYHDAQHPSHVLLPMIPR
jgi:uncharacterized protein